MLNNSTLFISAWKRSASHYCKTFAIWQHCWTHANCIRATGIFHGASLWQWWRVSEWSDDLSSASALDWFGPNNFQQPLVIPCVCGAYLICHFWGFTGSISMANSPTSSGATGSPLQVMGGTSCSTCTFTCHSSSTKLFLTITTWFIYPAIYAKWRSS